MQNHRWWICASHSLPVYVSKRSNTSFVPSGEGKTASWFCVEFNEGEFCQAKSRARPIAEDVCVADPSNRPNSVPRVSHPALATFSAGRRHSRMHDHV